MSTKITLRSDDLELVVETTEKVISLAGMIKDVTDAFKVTQASMHFTKRDTDETKRH